MLTNVELPPSGAPNLSAPTQSNTGSYTINWGAVSGATFYTLQQKFGSGAWTSLPNITALTWSVSGQAAGSYSYRIKSCNPAGCSGYSATKVVVVTYPPTGAPSLSAPASNTTGSYNVTWPAVSTATSYTLQESFNNGSWTTRYNGATRSYIATGQIDGNHRFRAQACNVGGCGPWSAAKLVSVEVTPAMPSSLDGHVDIDYDTRPPSNTWYVNWGTSSGASSYDLQVQVGTFPPNIIPMGTSLTYQSIGKGTRKFWVRACKSTTNCSAWRGPLQL